MRKKFLVISTVLLVLLLLSGIFGCSPYEKPKEPSKEEEVVERTQLVKNGTFYDAKSGGGRNVFVKDSVKDWKAVDGGSRSSLSPSAEGVTTGVVDLSNEEVFNSHKDKFIAEGAKLNCPGVDPATPYDTDDDGNPTDKLQDVNALLISSKTTAGSLYYENSSKFNLKAGKYYLLQYSVCTGIDLTDVADEDKDKKGARVEFSGGIYHLDNCINTEGEWRTRKIYIESNKHADSTVAVKLWLGHGPEKIKDDKTNPYLAKGAVLFDNIICKEITELSGQTLDRGTFAELSKNPEEEGVDFKSIYYLSNLNMEQIDESTRKREGKYYYGFKEGSSNVEGYKFYEGKKDIAGYENKPTVDKEYSGIVDFAKLYNKKAESASEPESDNYSSLLDGKKKFAPTYKEWEDIIEGKIAEGGVRADLEEETKALMIAHRELSGAGYVSKNPLIIEKGRSYVISVWAYVWAPTGDGGVIKFPEYPGKKPSDYTSMEKAIKALYEDEKKADNLSDYFKEPGSESLPEVELKDTSKGFQEKYNEIIKGETYKSALADKYGKYTYESSDGEKSLADLPYIEAKFLYENKEAYFGEELQGGEAFLRYKYQNGWKRFYQIWKSVDEKIKKWEKYDNASSEHDGNYAIWRGVNGDTGPVYAKVKLTGAGKDIEAQTEKMNAGWEKITFYIRGNQLSDRKLKPEFWFGEGTKTEYDKLMIGGVFFDNMTIEECEEGDYEGKSWQILSPLTEDSELAFGGLVVEDPDDPGVHWSFKANEGTAKNDEKEIELTYDKENVSVKSIQIGDEEKILRELVYTHKIPTASVLKCKDAFDIKPNKAYRLAMWLKTDLSDKNKGITVELTGKEKDSDAEPSAAATVSDFKNTEWKEIVFYVRGDTLKTNEVSLKFTMGSGDRFGTEKYAKGSFRVAVINFVEIEYDEYKSSEKSGDEVKSHEFSNSEKISNGVKNGDFAAIDLGSTDKEEFDDYGNLKGVGVTKNWTKGAIKQNTFNKPTLETEKQSGEGYRYVLKWKGVEGKDKDGKETTPSGYEIYVKFTEDGKQVEKLYKAIKVEDLTPEGEYYKDTIDLTGRKNVSVRMRAISDKAVSPYSDSEFLSGDPKAIENFSVFSDDKKKEAVAGTVVDNKYKLFEGSSYKSPYSAALKIESNYLAALQMTTESSENLGKDSFYRVSVWVKTVSGAKAGVTVSNISDVLTADVDKNYIGYMGINTDGKWVQYCFLIETGPVESTLKLVLSLGNPYAVKTTVGDNKIAIYDEEDLSMGTVYFDAVKISKIDKNRYDAEIKKGEYEENGTPKRHEFDAIYDNDYVIRKLIYTVNSFDSFKEETDADSKNGNAPNGYERVDAADATGTGKDDRLYGVYNWADDDKLSALYKNSDDENVFEDFAPKGFDVSKFLEINGYNSLVMSNKKAYGQSYTTDNSVKVNKGTYYKLSFKAKAMVAKETKKEDGGEDDPQISVEGVNAEFRYMPKGNKDTYRSILINSPKKTDGRYGGDRFYEAQEYSVYIYNPSKSDATAKWSFLLGDNPDEKNESGTGQFLLGMMVVDQVALTPIKKEEYDKATKDFDALSDEEKKANSVLVYSYEEDKPEESEPDDDGDADDGKSKGKRTGVFDRGEIWLLVSSVVIAVVIIVVVVVVVVRRWEKRHPREVVGENVTKTEKEIKVVLTPVEKVEAVESDEYSDEIQKPLYVPRKNPKKKNKKKHR